MNTRRRFILGSALALSQGVLPTLARAQALGKPARLLIGYPPGGSIDAIGRTLAEKMRGSYAPTVVVENRPGNLGAAVVSGLLASPPDGSAFMIAPHSVTTLWPHVYKNLPFDYQRDLLPISTVNLSEFAFVVRASVPATNLAEYLDWYKTNPKTNGLYGVTGTFGGIGHLLGMLFGLGAGIELTPISYKGTVQGITDLLGGQTLSWLGPLADIEPFYRAGKVRVLATTGPKRSRFVPQVPSFTEAGYPAVLAQERFGISARAGSSPAVVQALNKAVRDAVETAEYKAMCERQTSEPSSSTPEQFEAIIRREHERWGGVIKAVRFSPQE
ncbi:MAG: Bug family tripartite tricarboxylate transporter substrate binding protein [Burkholderiales bacterium]